MIYLFVIILLILFTFRYDVNKKEQYRNECYLAMLLLFIFIAGLRFRIGLDTVNYLSRFYYKTPLLSNLTIDDLGFGKDPLYTMLNSVVLTFGGKFWHVQIINAIFVNTLLFKYIFKHTKCIFFSILIFFIWQYGPICMEEMRASMGLVLCLFANDFILERKWIKGLCLYTLGVFFHASIIVVVAMSLLFFLRLNIVGALVILGAIILGFCIQPFAEDMIMLIDFNDVINKKIEGYATNDEYLEKHLNYKGYLLLGIVYLYSIISLILIKNNKYPSRLKKLEPLLMIFLIFSAINVGIPIFYRFARFYVIYYIMFVSELFVYLFRLYNMDKVVATARAFILMIPLLYYIATDRLDENIWPRYHPYSSIIDMELNSDRERLYMENGVDRPSHKY